MNRRMWILILVLIVSGSSLMAETFTDSLVAARKNYAAILASPKMVALKKQAAEKRAKVEAIEARMRASKTKNTADQHAHNIARRAARIAGEKIMRSLYRPVDQLTRAFPVEVDWLTQTQTRPGMDPRGRPIGVLRHVDPEKGLDFMAPATQAAIRELTRRPIATALQVRHDALLADKTPFASPLWVTLFVD